MLSIIIIDNNDSFTYNLVEVMRSTNLCCVDVIMQEDVTSAQQITGFDGIVLSPGPGLPAEKKGLFKLISQIEGCKPILGVCLGHQALAEFYGAKLRQLDKIVHGESSVLDIIEDDLLFNSLNNKAVWVGRYHSWCVDEQNFPAELKITSRINNSVIMSFTHRPKNICGVQFHPESILTPFGKQILSNWLSCFVMPNVKTNS